MSHSPKSWKDFFKLSKSPTPNHKWIISGGGSKKGVRSWGFTIDSILHGELDPLGMETFIKYKCEKWIGGEIYFENEENKDLTCEEIIIKNIIE